MFEKLVSIIVPFYNSSSTIRKCLDSLLSQSYRNLEIIAIDDGSDDDSLSIAREYSKKNNLVKVFCNPKKGVSSARNYGLEKSKGDYIIFADSDDWIDNNCVEYALNIASQYQSDIVMWNLVIERQGKAKINTPLIGEFRIFDKKDIDYLFGLMLTYKSEIDGMTNISLAGPVCKMYSKSSISNFTFPEDLDLGEDLLFNLRAFDSINKIVYIDKPFYHYYISDSSLTNKIDLNYSVRKARFVNKIADYLDTRNNKMEKEINIASYKNYLTVIEKYLFYFKGLKYRQRVKSIKEYNHQLHKQINYSNIRGALSFFVRHGLFLFILLIGRISRKYSTR